MVKLGTPGHGAIRESSRICAPLATAARCVYADLREHISEPSRQCHLADGRTFVSSGLPAPACRQLGGGTPPTRQLCRITPALLCCRIRGRRDFHGTASRFPSPAPWCGKHRHAVRSEIGFHSRTGPSHYHRLHHPSRERSLTLRRRAQAPPGSPFRSLEPEFCAYGTDADRLPTLHPENRQRQAHGGSASRHRQ